MNKYLFFFSNIITVLVGLNNNCNSQEGLIYCKNSNNCIYPLDTPCSDFYLNCDDCLEKQRNGINIACPLTCNTIQVIQNEETDNCDINIPDCDNTYVCPKILICDSLAKYKTYKLFLLTNSNQNIINIYALFGDSENNMIIPPAYQSPASSYGINIGGIPDNIKEYFLKRNMIHI